MREQIKRVHDASFGLYGTRKVWHQLRREGVVIAKCTVERLMRAMGLAGVRRGKTTVTTISNPNAPCPLDKVNREFRVSRPNALWVVDFTYGAPRPGQSGGAYVGMQKRKEEMNECLAPCCEEA